MQDAPKEGDIEIRDEAGAENFFLFGLNAGEVSTAKKDGYRPADYYRSNASLRDVVDAIAAGEFHEGIEGRSNRFSIPCSTLTSTSYLLTISPASTVRTRSVRHIRIRIDGQGWRC